MHPDQAPQPAAVDHFAATPADRAADQAEHLAADPRCLDRRDHFLGPLERRAQRLVDIDVLAGPRRGHRHPGPPLGLGAQADQVHVVTLQGPLVGLQVLDPQFPGQCDVQFTPSRRDVRLVTQAHQADPRIGGQGPRVVFLVSQVAGDDQQAVRGRRRGIVRGGHDGGFR